MEKKMENEMETREYMGLYWGYIGIMEKKMEATIVYFKPFCRRRCSCFFGRGPMLPTQTRYFARKQATIGSITRIASRSHEHVRREMHKLHHT